jgi:GT2 family glycosyltransferase
VPRRLKASDGKSTRLKDELEAARGRITELEAELQRIRVELARSTDSASARIALSAARKARRLVPPESRRQQSLHTAASRTLVLVEHGPAAVVGLVRRERGLRRAIGVADTPTARRRQYRRWLALHTPTSAELARMRGAAHALKSPAVISVVMPVHDPDPAWLEAAIRSVLGQVYPHLQLCIADDASTKLDVRAVLERAAGDPRVRVAYRDQQGGIAAASNSAIELATGDFVGFLDHDDVIRPHALYAMAAYIRDHVGADLVYSDEDKLLPDGGLGAPAFKPEYSPDRLLAENYINHFTMVRRSLLVDVGGFREGFDGSQDHDLMLRVSERAKHVGHVSDVLYAWRMAPGSTAIAADRKPMAQDAGRRAAADALQRRGVAARVDFGPSPGLYMPRYHLVGAPTVDVLLVARTSRRDEQESLASVERHSTYARKRVAVVPAEDNVAAAINAAAKHMSGDHIVLLDASTRVITPEWLEVMLELSQRDGIGAVGPRLRYPDGSVAHEGVVLGRLGVAACVDQLLRVIKESSAVSGACLMTRRDVFEQAGGMDERFGHALFDADYCLRVRALGHRVLCTPLAELTWGDAEGGVRVDRSDRDAALFTQTWGKADGIEDPYLNRNVLWPNPLSLRLDQGIG